MVGGGTIQLGALKVQRLGFGTMQLTGRGVWGPPADHDAAITVLRRSLELGVTLLDTADSYGPYVAEELVREALYPYPEGVVIATKAGFTRSGPDQWQECGRPDYLRAQCEGSLLRLGVDQIDLFQLHRVDPHVNADEQFGVLKELRDDGKVREVGLSQVSVAQIEAARRIVPLVSVQNLYNIAQRDGDDVVDFCEKNGIGFIPWFPLGSGKLSAPGGPLEEIASSLRRDRVADLSGLATSPIAGHGADSRHLERKAPRRELRRVGDHTLRRGLRRVDGRRVRPYGAGR